MDQVPTADGSSTASTVIQTAHSGPRKSTARPSTAGRKAAATEWRLLPRTPYSQRWMSMLQGMSSAEEAYAKAITVGVSCRSPEPAPSRPTRTSTWAPSWAAAAPNPSRPAFSSTIARMPRPMRRFSPASARWYGVSAPGRAGAVRAAAALIARRRSRRSRSGR
nr:hypothetical protein GCM10025730_01770 [Promicromonospora thailandica]